jgi:alpha-glucosidase
MTLNESPKSKFRNPKTDPKPKSEVRAVSVPRLGLPHGFRISGFGFLISAWLMAVGTLAPAATLTWDSNPTSASPGPDYGSGNWGGTLDNTNWWDGSANGPWNPGDIAVLGGNSSAAATVTLTNSVVAGGLIFSNTGSGAYALGAGSGSPTLSFSGAGPVIELAGSGGIQTVSPAIVATGGLSIISTTPNTSSGISFRCAAAANNIVGSLSLGTPGNASYTTPTALYVDFNNGALANVLNNTTNVTVYSNATLRVSGQNGSAYNLSFPKKITLSGDGQDGLRGAWVITGNAGGTLNANVTLAGDSTLMISSGGGGAYTYTETGTISGTGNLRLVNDSSFTTTPTLVLSGGPHTFVGPNTIIGGNLAVRLQGGTNRLPPNTLLKLGVTSGPGGPTVTGFGQLILGNSAGPANQTLAGLVADGSVAGCSVAGGNTGSASVLTVSNSTDLGFAGTLGGISGPNNMLGLEKGGAGTLSLMGTNLCSAGFTVRDGTLAFGDGVNDYPLAGPITNNAALVFNTASSLVFSDPITGTGTLTKRGLGSLTLSGLLACTGGTTLSNGTLLVNGSAVTGGAVVAFGGTLGGSGLLLGPVTIQAGATLAPGAGIGTLTISNSLLLAGQTMMEIDKLAGTNDRVQGLTQVTYGGTLVLSNLAGNYTIGDAFKLFDAVTYQGSFAALSPGTPGPGRAWDVSQLLTNGTLLVVSTNTTDNPPIWVSNPVVKPAANQGLPYSGTLSGAASDPDPGDTLSFSKVDGPAWLTVAVNGDLGGTPALADVGTNVFTVRVSDSLGLSSDATLVVEVLNDPNAPALLASPDGSLVLTFAVSNFDGSVSCPVYSVTRLGQPLISWSKLGLTFGTSPLQNNLTVTSKTNSSSDSTWLPVYGERSSIRDNYNQLVVGLQETVSPNRLLVLTFRAYNEGVAFSYTLPGQPGLTNVSALTEQTEFRFGGNYTAWSVTSAQGNYSTTTISGIPSGCERPLTAQVATNLYLSVGEARLVDYARMKFAPLAGKANSLVSSLSSSVTAALPLITPWRFIMLSDSPGHLLENNSLVLNLNDPCAIADTSWILPGKVIREITLTTTGGLACVDFAVKHHLQYVEFDAGWYGPENTTTDATQVNVDPARSPGPLDLQGVINYASSNGVGIILYVNQVALTQQIDILPALYRSWGVKGIKFGFVNVGSQAATAWLHDAFRKCATNHILVDAHDEYRPTGYTRTYPNVLTVEGISGDEATPTTSQDTTLLFSRMLAGSADHTVCYFDSRVTNNWSYAYQLAKAVCFYSPWQFIYWYDRPTNSYNYVSGAADMISEVPELEFYDLMPTVWDETRVLQAAIGQYAVIARRNGTDWFLGVMNAGQSRTFNLPLDFLVPGRKYVANTYAQDPTVATRTHVGITRALVNSSTVLSLTVGASNGQALRLTLATPPGFSSIVPAPGGGVSLVLTGSVGVPWSLHATTDLAQAPSSWSVLTNSLISTSPTTITEPSSAVLPRQYYRLSTP